MIQVGHVLISMVNNEENDLCDKRNTGTWLACGYQSD